MIIDYSAWRPVREELRGVEGVVRYLSHDTRFAATGMELGALHDWGIATALVFEDAPDRPTGGRVNGLADGEFAAAAAARLGLPAGRPIYAAVDLNVEDYAPASALPAAKLGPVAAYLEAFAEELAKARYECGAYGGYWLVSRALDARIGVSRAWQTTAWSGGMVDPRVCLLQSGQQTFSGNADLDWAGWRDWGQWRRAVVELTGGRA